MNKYNKHTLIDNWIPSFERMTGIIKRMTRCFFQQKTAIKKALFIEGSFGLGEQDLLVPNKWLYFITRLPVLLSIPAVAHFADILFQNELTDGYTRRKFICEWYIWRRVGNLHSSPTFTGPHYLLDTAPTSGVNPPPLSLSQIFTKIAAGFLHLGGVSLLVVPHLPALSEANVMRNLYKSWIPAFAGMTMLLFFLSPSPALAGELQNQFTISLWVKPNTSIASKALLGKAEEIRVFTDGSGIPGCQIKATSWQTAATGTQGLTLQGWSYITCTYDKAVLRLYVNGVQVGTSNLTVAVDDTSNTFKVGQDDSTSTTYTNLIGTVDQFQVYNYARTQKQIVEDMLGGGSAVMSNPRGLGPSTSGVNAPVGYYKFDEGYGTTANNSGFGGSDLNGTLNTATWTNSGKFGKALTFSSSRNDYVNLGDKIEGNSQMTISAWIKPTSIGSSAKSIAVKNIIDNFVILDNGKLHFNTGNGVNAWGTGVDSNAVLSVNNWYHVAASVNGTSVSLYINGALDKIGILSFSLGTYTNSADRVFGNWDTTSQVNKFDGLIDEVKIYNYTLTEDEVRTEYNQGSSLVLGNSGDNTNYAKGAANQEYCIPGDTTSCAAPVARWDFEEGTGTTVNDTSGNGKTGTFAAGAASPSWAGGKFGKALSFDGGDYVNMGTNAIINTATAYSISGWVNTSSVVSTGGKNVYSETNSAADAPSLYFGLVESTDKIQFQHYNNTYGWQQILGNTALSDGKWHYIAGTFSTTQGMALYLDGKLDNSNAALIYTQRASNRPRVGAYINGASSLTAYFNGFMDQVRIYNYALSPAQIAWDYNRGKPVGWWKMDECQGATAYDSSGNGNHGTLTVGASGTQTSAGTCSSGNSAHAWYNGVSGKRNYSLNFDGTDDYIQAGSTALPTGNNAFTTSAWIYPTTVSSRGIITWWGAESSSGANGFRTATPTDCSNTYGGLLHFFWGGGTNDKYWCSNTSIVNNWHHVVTTYNGTVRKIYFDGVEVTSDTPGNQTVSSSNLRIGTRATQTELFSGQLDDVKIFNYALTGTQVKDLYNGGAVFFGPSSGAP